MVHTIRLISFRTPEDIYTNPQRSASIGFLTTEMTGNNYGAQSNLDCGDMSSL